MVLGLPSFVVDMVCHFHVVRLVVPFGRPCPCLTCIGAGYASE